MLSFIPGVLSAGVLIASVVQAIDLNVSDAGKSDLLCYMQHTNIIL